MNLVVQLLTVFQVLDGDMFEKVQEFFSTLGRTELESAKTTLESFSKVLSDADLVNISCLSLTVN